MKPWEPSLKEFLDTQDLEQSLDISHVTTLIAHTLVYSGKEPPQHDEIKDFFERYIQSKFGPTYVKNISRGVASSYVGQIKMGTYLPHGYGRYRQSDGLFYEGWFKDGQYEGYGYGEGPWNSGIVKCGIWREGNLVKELHPKYAAIVDVRRRVKVLTDRHYEEITSKKEEKEYLYNADPNCDHDIVPGDNYSGIKCSKCSGWFCY